MFEESFGFLPTFSLTFAEFYCTHPQTCILWTNDVVHAVFFYNLSINRRLELFDFESSVPLLLATDWWSQSITKRKPIIGFRFLILYTSASASCDTISSKIESGYAFLLEMKDSFAIPPTRQVFNNFALLTISVDSPEDKVPQIVSDRERVLTTTET